MRRHNEWIQLENERILVVVSRWIDLISCLNERLFVALVSDEDPEEDTITQVACYSTELQFVHSHWNLGFVDRVEREHSALSVEVSICVLRDRIA